MQYEFEDVLRSIDDVQLLSPYGQPETAVSPMGRRAVNAARQRLRSARPLPTWATPSMHPTSITTDHELFFAVFHFADQLAHLHRLKGWRERSRHAVCLIIEAYSGDLHKDADYFQLLREFDEVYVCNPSTISGVQALGLRPPTFMPPAVDALRFAPLPRRPLRVLDFYNYGRVAPVPHQALLRLVEEQGLTYLYDSRGNATVPNHVEHRALLANMMQRSKFFFAYRVNDSPERRERTGGDEVLTTRYFEAAAGGTVMLGSRTQSPEFDACFDWPDVVVPMDYAEQDVEGVLRALSAEPERLSAIRTSNVRNSLRRHDWLQRWTDITSSAGLSPTVQMQERHEQVEALASIVELPPEGLVPRA